jgi:Mn-containing catalase
MKKLIYTTLLLLSVMAVKAQGPVIVFLHADATIDTYEFMVMTRSNLTNMSTRDAGICSNGSFRTNEADVQGYGAFADVPAGTIFQIRYDNTGTVDNTVADGRVMQVSNYNALLQVSGGGEQIIAYTGTASGGINCAGSGTNTYVSGINWGNSGWTSGATNSGTSLAPGTIFDFAYPGAFNKVEYTSNIAGDAITVGTNILNPTNWTGAATGDGAYSLKNILFNESNYTAGTVNATPALTSATLNLSSLTFGNANTDTRYAVIVSTGTPSLPVDRYTCYNGISLNFGSAPVVATGVSGQTAGDFCGTPTNGTGVMVYLDYTLPSSLTIAGLLQNTTYNYKVVAVNGNGYTANFSSTPYTGTFTTLSPANTSVQYSVIANTVNENVGTVPVALTITNPSPTVATTVQVAITGGTGSAADVNNYTTQTVTFPAGSSANQTVTLTVTDDILVEGTETVIFTIQNITGGQGTPVIGSSNPYTLTITDNDVLPNTSVQYSVIANTVNENVGTVPVALTITNPSPTVATTVQVAITGGTGSAADVNNYTTQTVTFPAGSSANQTVTLTVTDDLLVEGTETVIFTIQNITGGQGTPVIGSNNPYTLTITDNDVLPNTSVQYSVIANTVNENVGTVPVALTITNPSPTVATTVQVAITGGTGSAADVNNYTTQTVTFPAGSSANQTVTLTVTDDILVEGTETVIFTIQNITGGQGTPVIGSNNPYTLTITDNDVLPNTSVQYSVIANTVNENVGTVPVALTITNPSPTVATTVQVAITGGTGSAADVNNYTTQTVTFPAGSSANQTVTLTVTDDILVEGTETVIFTIQNITGGQGTPVIGSNNPYTLTITDNDLLPPANTTVEFGISPGSVIENVGLVGVILNLTNPSPTQATTVQVVVKGGSGSVADIDNYVTQTITFPANSTLQAASITITDDLLLENTETIIFAIRNIAGGQGTPFIGADSTFTLTITDNDVAPNIIINEIHYNPSESSGSPDAQYEFIELFNGENYAVDLSGFTFSQGVTFTFPANTTIDPSEYIIIAIDAATYSGQGYDVYQWASGDLDNTGETIELRNADNFLIDIVTYDEVSPWPTGANNTGPSLELIDEPLDNALPVNWRANGPKNGTPGNPNTLVSVAENNLGQLVTVYGFGNQLYINVDNNFTANYTLNIIDMAGRTMGTYQNLSGSNTLNTNLPAGLYVVQCVSNSGILTKKIAITN